MVGRTVGLADGLSVAFYISPEHKLDPDNQCTEFFEIR